jgi:hypothetical protein
MLAASEDAVILSGATLFSVLFEDDRQKRCTRTLETCLAPHLKLPFFILTFGASKASHGYFMRDEVGWH